MEVCIHMKDVSFRKIFVTVWMMGVLLCTGLYAGAAETEALRREWEERMKALGREEEKFAREKEKFLASSKAEARRIVSQRTAEAEEILSEIEEIFKKESISESDLIHARTLKNTLKRGTMSEDEAPIRAEKLDAAAIRAGMRVRIGSMQTEGTVLSVGKEKAEVRAGVIRVKVPLDDLYTATDAPKPEVSVQLKRDVTARADIRPEVDLIGMTTAEMESELEKYLDSAVLAGLAEVRIVHDMGTGKLRAAVHAVLKKHPHVASFRLGKYGEGETGVTIATLK